MDLETLCGKMEETVRRAGAYVRTAVPQAIDEKSGHSDLVTEYDVQTQRMLMEELSALYPEAEFMGEEEHLQADVTVGDCFVIDPIDGTANFVAGYNRSAVSVALLRDGQPVLGMVYHPWAEEFFSAIKGKGAFLNGRKLTLSDRPLADSLVGFARIIGIWRNGPRGFWGRCWTWLPIFAAWALPRWIFATLPQDGRGRSSS